jgi:nucleoid-associated protein YgaU
MPPFLYNEGLELAKQGAFGRAEESLQAALRLDPKLTEARLVLGKIQAQQGRLGEAIRCWEGALEAEPGCKAARAAILRARRLIEDRSRRGRVRRALVFATPPIVFLLGWTASSFSPLAGGPGAPPERGSVPAPAVDPIAAAPPAPLPRAAETVLRSIPGLRIRGLRVTGGPEGLVLEGSTLYRQDAQAAVRIAQALPGVSRVISSDLRVEAMEYEVRPGDNLWSLADRFYEQPALWPRIAGENPELRGGECPLRPGQRLRIPPVPEPEPPGRAGS